MTLKKFEKQVLAVCVELLNKIGEFPPDQNTPPPPKDDATLLKTVRGVAEDLILCSTLDEAISLLQQDQVKAVSVAVLIGSMVKPKDSALAIKLAHASTLHEPSILPLHAFCAYLIEICNRSEPELSE